MSDFHGYQKAQRAYDAQMPPEDNGDCEEDCDNCDGTGEVKQSIPEGAGIEKDSCPTCDGTGKVKRHHWKKLPGEGRDGERFARCTRCGKEDEI